MRIALFIMPTNGVTHGGKDDQHRKTEHPDSDRSSKNEGGGGATPLNPSRPQLEHERTTMKTKMLFGTAATALMLLAAPAHALIVLSPNNADHNGAELNPPNPNDAANEQSYIETLFGISGLTMYYKADVGGPDSGTFDTSYDTSFSPSNDPAGALISYIGGTAISCPECYMAVKDGRHEPSYYFFDLGSWNGTESIELQNFWPAGGAISHISIWGVASQQVPEPSSLALLGLASVAFAGIRTRRQKQRAAA